MPSVTTTLSSTLEHNFVGVTTDLSDAQDISTRVMSTYPIATTPFGTHSIITNMEENNAYSDDDRENSYGGSHIHSMHTLFLEKPPCCLEFSPLARDYFIVGTYNLVDDAKEAATDSGSEATDEAETTRTAQQRDGSLILCRIGGDEM